VIGIAAVKYFDLKQNRLTNYAFSYDKMLDPRGNTAVYLLYAYARICAIIRKSGSPTLVGDRVKIVHEKERLLVLELLKFPDVIGSIVHDLHIHRLPEFMWDLSNRFSQFYTECRVVGSEEEQSRLALCEATRKILKNCFNLLGIEPLERM
jgi:arginyl-tRNA synthetase